MRMFRNYVDGDENLTAHFVRYFFVNVSLVYK